MKRVAVCLLLSAGLLAAQVPRIAVIDFYGLQRLTENRLREALRLKEGDPLPPSKADAEERLERVDDVVLSRLEAVCCESGGAILFVGIEEKGAPHFDLHNPPASSAALPEEVTGAYRVFLDRLRQSARSSEARESLRLGYAQAADPENRGLHERFASLADENFATFREVLRESADVNQRVTAAYLLGYLPSRQETVETLQYALQDPEEAVRQTALRALEEVAAFAAEHPGVEIRIAPTWAIQMLHSIYWGDRMRAARFLVTLTDGRNKRTLDQIKDGGLASLVEMASWDSLAYALPAYILLGRMADMSEEAIQDTWGKGQRDSVISRFADQRR
jgi:hypothetical protein